jgi:hypothetical protein
MASAPERAWRSGRGPSGPFDRAGGSGEFETIKVQYLDPRPHEVRDEPLLSVRTGADFSDGPKLGVGAEDQVDARTSPFDLVRPPVAHFEYLVGTDAGLPLRGHVQQVDEEAVRQRLWPLGEDAIRLFEGVLDQLREPRSHALQRSEVLQATSRDIGISASGHFVQRPARAEFEENTGSCFHAAL